LDRTGAGRHWLIWAAVLPTALWAVIRVFGLERGFPLVPLIAYTPYVAIAAFLAAGIALALRNWAAATLAALATACLAAVVLPRAVGSEAVDPAGHEQLVVLSANIHHGTADPLALVALVERFDPDLLSVQELTPRFAAELRAAGIGRLLPNADLSVQRDVSGAGIYTRLPLRILPEPRGFQFRMPRVAIELPGGRRMRVVGVHPYPPLPDRVGEWGSALESLPTAGSGVPWVLAGDFNATLDHVELRDVLDRGYRDSADVTAEGLQPTWPQGTRRSPPVTIDHILFDRRLGVAEYAVEDLPGSDHRAVYARLVLP
jgi:endonuclease/exonuclease/phosphatase family metal-dependent hydrolase